MTEMGGRRFAPVFAEPGSGAPVTENFKGSSVDWVRKTGVLWKDGTPVAIA
jgi:hypothetical protein